jgi:integrase
MRPQRHRAKASPANGALVPVLSHGTEIALPEDLIASAKGFAKQSRAAATRRNYGIWWKDFTGWCQTHGRQPLPASVETVVAYVTWLASGNRPGRWGTSQGKPLAPASIDQALAAVKLAQRTAGYLFDSDAPLLKEVTKGIRRASAQTRTVRRVKPLMKQDLSDILEGLDPALLREARDAALLALGWAGAMRRSEVVGLDWRRLGTAEDEERRGFVTIDDTGITITLMTSKASQDTAQTIIVPRDFAPLLCKAVENWIEVAKIGKGTPLFRPIEGKADGKRVGSGRMTAGHVARIVKRRIHVLIKARSKGRNKMSREEIGTLTAMFAGHSMRAGYATSAAEADMPAYRIKQQTRHKSDAVLNGYIRDVDKRTKSGLKGVGF